MRRFSGFSRSVIVVSLLGLIIIACSSSGLPSTLTPTIFQAPIASFSPTAIMKMPGISTVTSTPGNSLTEAIFKIAVIVDMLSEPVTRGQAQAIVDEASTLIQPFIPIGIKMIDFAEDGSGGTTKDMADRYLVSHSTTQANGILIFSFGDNGQAKLHDGYGYNLPAPTGYKNDFVSPIIGRNQIYIAVVRFRLKYMPCGYGVADTVQSGVSIGSECRNKPGTTCVQTNGYSMCSNAVGNLYTSTPTHFLSSTIIHVLLHMFSAGGEKDNYASSECNSRMSYPPGFFDLQEYEYYNGICPFVYDNFAASYQP